MKILFEKRFLKDIESVNEKNIKAHLEIVISEIEKAKQITAIPSLKKLKGHKSAYRIQIGNYRIGFFYENHTVIFTRLLNRKDIYKYFP